MMVASAPLRTVSTVLFKLVVIIGCKISGRGILVPFVEHIYPWSLAMIPVFNALGQLVAWFNGQHLFDLVGNHVVFIVERHLYNHRGKHIGYLEHGYFLNNDGCAVGFISIAHGGPRLPLFTDHAIRPQPSNIPAAPKFEMHLYQTISADNWAALPWEEFIHG